MSTIVPVAKVVASLARNSTGPASTAVLAMRRCGQTIPGDEPIPVPDIVGDTHGKLLQACRYRLFPGNRIHPDTGASSFAGHLVMNTWS